MFSCGLLWNKMLRETICCFCCCCSEKKQGELGESEKTTQRGTSGEKEEPVGKQRQASVSGDKSYTKRPIWISREISNGKTKPVACSMDTGWEKEELW